MDKVFVVKRVAEKLWSTEEAIDAAIAETSRLMAELVDARKELKVSHSVTDGATARIAASMAAMAEARTAMMDAHNALTEAKLRIGVRTPVRMDGIFKPAPLPHIEEDSRREAI